MAARRRGARAGLALLAGVALSAPLLVQPAGAQMLVQPAGAQMLAAPVASEADARIDAILAGMSVEQKVAQVVQPDTGSVTPADMALHRFGSILSGGNSAPENNERAAPSRWLALADAYWDAAMAPRADGSRPIPPLWAIDALHGHNNIIGATIFPHNIGLGAARDAQLVHDIGAATALEIAVTGIDWTFAPTLAVVRDQRWGRTYESYSESPAIVASLAGAMVEGLQGKAGTPGFLGPGKVIATAKHFIGDGGTAGRDQGDTMASEADIRRIHAAGYPPAIAAGVQTVMASFSSLNGVKMHGNMPYLTGYLRGDLGFKGLVVGDWNGHGLIPGCSVGSCAASFNAGLDIFMAPDSWRALLPATLAQVRGGEITTNRLDEAVRRILRVKLAAGLFDKGRPSTRPFAGKTELLASADHRELARRAVRETLVLLKNNDNILPLKPAQTILVTGAGADSIPMQAGGWTVSWQGGGDLTNGDFPQGQSIYRGIAETVARAGGTATLSADGGFATKPDAAIVIFGERPYAEFIGDVATLDYDDDLKAVTLMKRLRTAGVPVVAVLLSGRPLWVNREINQANAFVAAFLPGTEGGGIADILFRKTDGDVAHDFRGKLSFGWPNSPAQPTLEATKADARTLFPLGYGLSYGDRTMIGPLTEARPPAAAGSGSIVILDRNGLPAAWAMRLAQSGGRLAQSNSAPEVISSNIGRSPGGTLSVRGIDRYRQEDARRIDWRGDAPARVDVSAARVLDLSAAGQSLVIDWRVDTAPTAAVRIGIAAAGDTAPAKAKLIDATRLFAAPAGQWRTVSIPLRCLAPRAALTRIDKPFIIETSGRLSLALSGVRIAPAQGLILPCPGAKRR
jgi:beta-glucosidase